MLINNKNNHAQIGVTLSWFVAFLIIFFVIILFLSASTIYSGSKKLVSGSDKINLEKRTNELLSFEILLSFLDKKIVFNNEKTNIKDIIISNFDRDKRVEVKEKLKQELDVVIKENFLQNECYLFDIEYPDSNLNYNGFDVCSFICTDEEIDEYIDQYKARLLSKSLSFNLYSEKGIVKIKFYLGEC